MAREHITMKDVAEAAGVSVMTVSYALRGSKKIPEATRQRILSLAEKLGYQRDPLLTRLSSYRTGKRRREKGTALAWLNLHRTEATWNYRGSHYLESLEGAGARARNLGYRLDTFSLHEQGGWPALSRVLRSRGIEGVIIGQPPAGVDSAHLEWKYFATVAIGRAVREPEMPRVLLNHVECVGRTTEKMWERGHRRVGLVMEEGECQKNGYRNVGGYYGFCEKTKVSADYRIPPYTPKKLTQRGLASWIRRYKVDGILVHRPDQMAKMLPALGLRVPADVGYAHISKDVRQSDLSGLFFDPAHFGSWAVDLVHWLLDREEYGLPEPSPALMLTSDDWVEGATLRAG